MVFKKLKGLPPSRSRDHQIVFKQGTPPSIIGPIDIPIIKNHESLGLV